MESFKSYYRSTHRKSGGPAPLKKKIVPSRRPSLRLSPAKDRSRSAPSTWRLPRIAWAVPPLLLLLAFGLLRLPLFSSDSPPAGAASAAPLAVLPVGENLKRIGDSESTNHQVGLDEIGDLVDENGNEIDLETLNPLRAPVDVPQKAILEREAADYVVRPGDTLWSVARRFRVSTDSLVSFNRMESVHRLNPGDHLRIPRISGVWHRVRPGETFEGIARQYGCDLGELRRYQNTEEALSSGDRVFVPGAKLPAEQRARLYGVSFSMPVNGTLTSTYGMRVHPILQTPLFHTGIDLGAPVGEPVRAAGEGTVIFAGANGHYGNQVVIRHPSGYETAYGHLSAIRTKAGRPVRSGEVVGTVGNTGLSTGPHLHFEVKVKGQFLNPLRYLSVPGAPALASASTGRKSM